tara:strand:+ start:14933 stop:15661 length:729 start_codon:yes stop_codon:yes gene_type:complete
MDDLDDSADGYAPKLNPQRALRLGPRLLTSLVLGLLVYLISVVTAFVQHRADFGYRNDQRTSQGIVDMFHLGAEVYHQHKGDWPSELYELTLRDETTALPPWHPYEQELFYAHFEVDDALAILDAWGHALSYDVVDGNANVLSFGRDGVPGGVGHNADLVGGRRPGPAARATFFDFLFHQPSRGMLDTALLTGVLTFLASMVLISGTRVTRSTWITVGVTVMAAIFACAIMTSLHIPQMPNH